jgi:hypothetical protein
MKAHARIDHLLLAVQIPNVSRVDYDLIEITDDDFVRPELLCCTLHSVPAVSLSPEAAFILLCTKLLAGLHARRSAHVEWPALLFIFASIVQVTLMTESGDLREDLSLPNQTDDDIKLSEQIRADVAAEKELTVSVLKAMGDEKIVAVKTRIENK